MASLQNIDGEDFLIHQWPKMDANTRAVNAELVQHKASSAAHSADSITYGGGSVKAELENQNQRINNLASSAGDSNTEIVDSRYDDFDGVTFTVLKDRLDTSVRNTAQLSLNKLVADMAAGLPVTIECWGDSTYYGFTPDSANVQVAVPAPKQLENILRAYYGNDNISVVNHGLSGNQTTNALRTWAADMDASAGSVIYINYCINDMWGGNPPGVNDPPIDGETYRKNLRDLVRIAREKNKIVVFETPNIVTQYGTYGTQQRAEGVKQFAAIMRQVATEMSCVLIDGQRRSELYAAKGLNMIGMIGDGFHPTQEYYLQKGQDMAAVLIRPGAPEINQPMVIPSTGPAIQARDGSNGTVVNTASLTSVGRFAKKIAIPLIVENTGMDVYIATPVWIYGSTSVNVRVDTVSVGTFSLNNAVLDNPWAVDQEILVAEDITPGLHLIELIDEDDSPDTEIGLFYARTRPTRRRNIAAGVEVGAAASVVNPIIVASNLEVTVPTGASESQTLFDIPTSRFLKDLDITVEARLGKSTGFMVFGHRMGADAGQRPFGGLYVFLFGDTGYLSLSEGGKYTYDNITTIGNVDLSTAKHVYRVKVTSAGMVTVFVDGVQVGSTYTMQKNYFGGFFGVYLKDPGMLYIDNVSIN